VLALAVLVAFSTSVAGASPSATVTKVAIITDTAGLNDKSFNHLANMGRLRAQRQLNLQTRVFISANSSEYLPNHVAAGQQGYQAVVANGFLLSDALNTAAQLQRIRLKSARLSKTATALLNEIDRASDGKLRFLRWAMYGNNQPQHPIHRIPSQEREVVWEALKSRTPKVSAMAA